MTCEKISYKEKGGAIRVMRRMQRTVRGGPLPVRVYYCTQHKAWHITSKPRNGNHNGG